MGAGILPVILHHIYPKYWDSQAWTNSVEPDQNVASDQGLHYLPLF